MGVETLGSRCILSCNQDSKEEETPPSQTGYVKESTFNLFAILKSMQLLIN
jgi:hypothetical protein